MHFPLELVHSIIEYVPAFDEPKDTFLACRLVSRAFSSIATPLAFRVINLSQCNDSSYTFNYFMEEDTQLRELVKELNFTAFPAEDPDREGGEKCSFPPPYNSPHSLCPVDSVEQSCEIFSAIGMFENLQTLRLEFEGYCAKEEPRDDDGELDDETMSTSRLLQIRILQALAELGISEVLPNPIRHLEIHGLLALPNPATFMDGLHRFTEAMCTLTLDIVSEPMVDQWPNYPSALYEKFWNGDFRRLALSRPFYYLTSLTLKSDVPTVGPGCIVWHSITYFELRHLSLQNMIFNDEMLTPTTPNDPSKPSGLESFILSQTLLESLELKDCSLNIAVRDGEDEGEDDSDEDEDIPPRMWSDILDGFGKALKRLKNFEFTPFPIRPYIDFSNSNGPGTGYVTFREEFGYGSIDPEDTPQRDEVDLGMDAAAFALIQQAIADRVASMN